MTLDRAAARARCEAATPGEWLWVSYLQNSSHPDSLVTRRWADGETDADSDVILCPVSPTFVRTFIDPGIAESFPDRRPSVGDAEFIAHARADLPGALDELDAKDAEIARLKDEIAALTPAPKRLDLLAEVAAAERAACLAAVGRAEAGESECACGALWQTAESLRQAALDAIRARGQ